MSASGARGRSARFGDLAAVPGETSDGLAAADVDSLARLEDGTNVWPDEAAEVAFIADQKEQGVSVQASAPAEAEEEIVVGVSLPALDDLVGQVPPAVREVMDELFRAKFVSVKRVPRKALEG